MKKLTTYILEKLKLTKDFQLSDEIRFVLFYDNGDNSELQHVVFGDRNKAKDFIATLKYPKQYLDGYACKNRYVNELIDKIERETNDVQDIDDKWDEIKDFALKNHIVRFFDYKEVSEKLHLNKDIEINNDKFILYYRKNNYDKYELGKVMDSLDELVNLRQTILKGNPSYRIIRCPNDLVDEFKDRWDHFNPIDFSDDGLWSWTKKHNIKELTASDVNNYFTKNKED